MKRLFSFFAIAALAATAFVSCNKEIASVDTPDAPQTVSFTIAGQIDQNLTKTYIENDGTQYIPHWSAVSEEKLGIVFDEINASSTCAEFPASSIENDLAVFSGSASVEVGEHDIFAFYPYSAFNKGYANGTLGLTLKQTQNPKFTTFDPACDILVAEAASVEVEKDDDDNILPVSVEGLIFSRPMAVLRVNLKAKDENAKVYEESVTSFEMNVTGQGSNFALTGNAAIDMSDGSISTWNVKNTSVKAVFETEEVMITDEDDFNSIYLVVNPATLEAGEGKTIEFSIETDVHNGINKIQRTVNIPTGGFELLAGKVNTIDLLVRDKDVPEIVTDTRILVEGFDNVKTNKSQAAATETGVFGTGVSEKLEYTYSTNNTNIRFNNNGQSSTNPYLYINAANQYLTMSNIVIDNQSFLNFSAKVKNSGTLTVKYKESSASTWSQAGTYTSTTTFGDASIDFTIANTVKSLDIQIVGSAALIVDDIVLQPGEAPAHNLSVTPTTVTLGGESGSTKTVTVTSNYEWTAALSSGVTGFAISPTTGGNGATITITASANGSTDGETTLGTFTVTDGENTETITVKQEQYVEGAESVVYTLTPANGSNSSYDGNCDIEVDDITWNLTGNSQMNPWRLGGKNISNKERTLYSKTPLNYNISEIVVTNGTASNITVNSFKLIVASDADFNTVVDEIAGTFAASSTTTFSRPEGHSWSNCYYKFVYNVTVSGNSNKFVQFTKAEFTGK